jgi:hypothetical protein
MSEANLGSIFVVRVSLPETMTLPSRSNFHANRRGIAIQFSLYYSKRHVYYLKR